MVGQVMDTRITDAAAYADLVWYSGQIEALTCRVCSVRADMAHVVTSPNFMIGGPEAAYFRCPACGTLNSQTDSFADYDSSAQALSSTIWVRHYIEVGAGIDSMIHPLVSAVPRIGGHSLLDVGCGFGFGVRYWNWAGGEAYGSDPSPYGELGHRILDGRIVPRYLSNVPELNGRNYDLVYASEVIEHVDDVTGFVRDLKAVTRPGGILALTTPNGDFIAADKPMSAVIAALSPGVHRLLFSLGALEAVLKQAGFTHVRAHASNEQLIAYASDAPLADGHGVDRPTYIRFLVETARDRSDPHLRMGLLYRAFKEQVNAGDRAGAEASCATLNALVQESFSLDLLDPAAVLVRVLGTVTLEDFRDRAPFFAPAFLYYAAMARLNWGAFLTDSAAGFAACAEAVHHCDRIAPSLFRELSALYWPAILHLGIARLCDGDHRAAAEALARFFQPKSDAPESPGPKLVSQARREMGVVELQTGNPEMAMHLFRQVIETADGNSKADAIKLYGLARQTADERIAPHLK